MHCPSLHLCCLLLTCFLAGCQTKDGPFYKPANFQALDALPVQLRRVLVLPIADDGKVQEATLQSLDEALIRSLTEAQRFECVPISRNDLQRLASTRSLRSVDTLPADLFQKLAEHFGADAVLFTDITRFDPYAPIALGIRAKLAQISDRSLIWSIDESFDGSKTSVSNAARHHWLKRATPDTPADMSEQVLQSPSKFAAYAFSAAFSTIPSKRR